MSIVKTRQTATQPSTGQFLQQMRLMHCTHPHQYGTPPSLSPMPHSLQQMAARWCHHCVCLVLTVEVHGRKLQVSQSCLVR